MPCLIWAQTVCNFLGMSPHTTTQHARCHIFAVYCTSLAYVVCNTKADTGYSLVLIPNPGRLQVTFNACANIAVQECVVQMLADDLLNTTPQWRTLAITRKVYPFGRRGPGKSEPFVTFFMQGMEQRVSSFVRKGLTTFNHFMLTSGSHIPVAAQGSLLRVVLASAHALRAKKQEHRSVHAAVGNQPAASSRASTASMDSGKPPLLSSEPQTLTQHEGGQSVLVSYEDILLDLAEHFDVRLAAASMEEIQVLRCSGELKPMRIASFAKARQIIDHLWGSTGCDQE